MHRSVSVVIGFAMTLAMAAPAIAGRPHFVGTPVCSVVGEQLCCSGKVAGKPEIGDGSRPRS